MEAKANDPDGVPILLDSTVTVRGIVTVGGEYGNPAVIQDATGAIAVYDAAFSDSAVIGDDVTIGAGSTITKDVPVDALALSRVEQVNVKKWKRKKSERKTKQILTMRVL